MTSFVYFLPLTIPVGQTYFAGGGGWGERGGLLVGIGEGK